MIDLKRIRENPKEVEMLIRKKGYDFDVKKFLELDQKRRKLQKERDNKRHRQKELTKLIADEKSKGESFEELLKETKNIAKEIKEIEKELKAVEKEFNQKSLEIPNLLHHSVSEEYTIVREWGKPKKFSFPILNHIELGESLGILEFKTTSKFSGTRFVSFIREGALLERALINFCLDLHTKEHGYVELSPPALVKEEAVRASGQLPHLPDEMYKTKDEGLWLIPTGETPLINLHSDSILKEEELPKKYVAYTPCFRREAGTYGKETKGLVRVHQFDKVELVQYTIPSLSYETLEEMVKHAEKVLQLLQLPYRTKLLPGTETAFQSAKTYDIDVWAPGMQTWLEVSSISNCEDFQARRNRTRLRLSDNTLTYPHILNGSGVAFARTFIAILENYQNKNGSITIPEVLRKYTGIKEIK